LLGYVILGYGTPGAVLICYLRVITLAKDLYTILQFLFDSYTEGETMAIDALVDVSQGDNFLENIALIHPETWQTALEVYGLCITEGRDPTNIITANLGVYRIEKGEVVFDLLGREGNILLDETFRNQAYEGMVGSSEFFLLPQPMLNYVMEAIGKGHSTHFPYTGLIFPENYADVPIIAKEDNTPEEIKLLKAVFPFESHEWANRRCPAHHDFVILLRPEEVIEALQNNSGGAIAMPCIFGENSYSEIFLGATFGSVLEHPYAVRGVPRLSLGPQARRMER
jgi:hypothetical protein